MELSEGLGFLGPLRELGEYLDIFLKKEHRKQRSASKEGANTIDPDLKDLME